MHFYSLRWEREVINYNHIYVIINGFTEKGECVTIRKEYEEWVGVCTDNIDKTYQEIQQAFPGIQLRSELLNESTRYKKIFPYFKQRLQKNTLECKRKLFYKMFATNALVQDIGIVISRYKYAYYSPADWLIRLYLDMNIDAFYYAWYYVNEKETRLLDALEADLQCTELPDVRIAAFDLETVALDRKNRIPTGACETDCIVMISILKWSYKYPESVEKKLLYLNPVRESLDFSYHAFSQESDLLRAFHEIVRDCHILTGYNINQFDLPCLLARLLWLNMRDVWSTYTSHKYGTHLVPTFQNKLVLDMYTFITVFSSYNLPSFKLDAVARCKLNNNCKFPIHPTTIHSYYTQPVTVDLLKSQNKEECFEQLKPARLTLSEFGTYSDCLKYCLKDSELTYELFCKELTLTFLIERANVSAITVEQALYWGNTRYILEVFKTYGTRLGYFLNMAFFHNTVQQDMENYHSILKNKTYQGALNYGLAGTFFQNVTALDFLSMYPSILLNENLSYETCGLVPADQPLPPNCRRIPYQSHSELDLMRRNKFPHDIFRHNTDSDSQWYMVTYEKEIGFLPHILHVFLEKRKQLQKEYKATGHSNLYTQQLNLKLFLNSVYGCMGSTDSVLAYVDIAIIITCFARIYLLAVSEYVEQKMGCQTVYCDTDGLFVVNYPYQDCNVINRYLNQQYMILQYEKRMTCILILSKKRYIYEEEDGTYKKAGFEKKANALIKWMSEKIVSEVLCALKNGDSDISKGWVIWVQTLIGGYLMSRNSKVFCITRKTKPLNEYKSMCPQLSILRKHPSKAGGYIEYTYCQTDIDIKESNKWIRETDECSEVNFEKLFMSQKKIFVDLLNIAFFHSDCPMKLCNRVLNTMRWKNFVNAEILTLNKFKKPLLILILKSVKYTFELNN